MCVGINSSFRTSTYSLGPHTEKLVSLHLDKGYFTAGGVGVFDNLVRRVSLVIHGARQQLDSLGMFSIEIDRVCVPNGPVFPI